MTRIIVSADARQDRNDILRYLEREAGAPIAEKYALRFRDTIKRLQDYPEIGSLQPALGAIARVAIIAPYLLIYDYASSSDKVTVLRILHGKRKAATKAFSPTE